MNENALTIFNHFGLDNQIEKLKEEVNELVEAIQENDIVHIEEEMADVLLLLLQFRLKLNILEPTLVRNMEYKIYRTLDRIEDGYYERLRK